MSKTSHPHEQRDKNDSFKEPNISRKSQSSFEEIKFMIDSRYRLKKVLGKGSYGTVCSAVDLRNESREGMKIAIKKVSNIFDKEVLMKRAIRELKLMRHFNGHKNIVKLIDLEIIYLKPFEGLYCFQEMIDYDLAKVIYSDIQFSQFHIQSFIYQILCGLKYIHSADVIHRDLKPGNILVTVQGTLKICDFGLSRGVSPYFLRKKGAPITNYVATRWYRAPELMLSNTNYTKTVDMWAVGCILAELFGRKPIFMGKDQMDQLHKVYQVLGLPSNEVVTKMSWIIQGKKHQYIPADLAKLYPLATTEALDLMKSFLNWDPEERLTSHSALTHKFFSQVRDPSSEPECKRTFDFSFENSANTIEQLRHLLHKEVEDFKKERGSPSK